MGQRRITLVSPTDYIRFQTGGVVAHCREFLRYTPKPGTIAAVGSTIDPRVPLGRWMPYPLRPEVATMAVYRTSLAEYQRRRVPFTLAFVPRLMPRIAQLMNEAHCVYAQSMELALPFLALRRGGKPRVVVAVHGLQSPSLFPGFRRVYPWLQRWGVHKADGVVLVSHDEVERYSDRYPAARHKLHLVQNGVDVKRFFPMDKRVVRARLGLPADAPVLAYVGRLSAEKDVRLTLDTFARVKRGRSNAMLLIVGEGPQRSALERHVLEGGLTDVRFLGEVSPDEMPAIYSAMDVLLLTSVFEGMPMTVIEALACGVPAVTTPVGECVRLLRAAGVGFTSTGRDPDELAALAERVLAGAGSSDACRALALEHSAQRMADELFGLLGAA